MTKTKQITADKVVTTSFLVDITDVVLNISVSIITGSVVVLADALQGVADMTSSGLLVYGVKKSKRPADKLHPFGHGRELFFWTLISGIIMFGVTATASIYFGLQRILSPMAITNIRLAIAVSVLGFITNTYSFTLSYRRLIGQKGFRKFFSIFTHSSIIETKTTLVQDLTGSLASVFSLIALTVYSLTGNSLFDGLGAILIGIMLLFFAYTLIRSIKELIVGISAPAEIEEKIKKAVKSTPEVTTVIDLRTIYTGPKKIFVNLELNLKDELTTDDIEAVTDKIQKKIKKIVPSVTDTTIELESPKEVKKV